jgi:HAE1 family hydrophobic/amphiphilic exporter-1
MSILPAEEGGSIDEKFLYNYAYTKIVPELQRIDGIARAEILGARKYAMRIWLKPDRMRAYKISAEEVMEALEEQSLIGRPGRLGRSSGITAQAKEFVLTYAGRYNTPEQYESIILKSTEEGQQVKLADIATVELGSEFFDIYSNLDGKPSSSIVLKQTLGSNGSKVIEAVKEKMEELARDFPAGITYQYSYDVSKFLDASIEQVTHTIRDAFILVALVVFLFLGDWRATLIPILAVPVSLIGAFFFIRMFGMSINLITLFALVLAIGIVVDNAIVVVEAVFAKMEENHSITPYDATKAAMNELSGAIIAITLVMTSVFIPVAFMGGPVGVFYRQFSITMASSIVISGVVALTLTPVLCAMLLKNHHGKRKKSWFDRFIDSFNRLFEKLTGLYVTILNKIVARRIVTFGMLALFIFGVYLPTIFFRLVLCLMKTREPSMLLCRRLLVLRSNKPMK